MRKPSMNIAIAIAVFGLLDIQSVVLLILLEINCKILSMYIFNQKTIKNFKIMQTC